MSDDFMDLLSGKNDDEDKAQGRQGPEDLLGSLTGGGEEAGGLGALLGGLMGGASEGSGGLGGLLGGLLGGGGGASGGAGGMGALLGGLLGGGGSGQMSFGGGGGPSLPFAGALAEKLGISEQMANTLIMGAIGLLTASMAKQRGSGRAGAIDYNSLTDPDFIRSSGVADRMASQMGISEDEAILGLQQTLGLMAAGSGQTAAKPKKAAAKKTTAKKTTTAKKPATAKKTTAKSSKTTPKKKSAKKESGSDFMDLLDDMTR
jgi:hypothetical protein